MTDPFRLAVAMIIGCAWRMAAAGVERDRALAEVRDAGASAGAEFPRACADAAVFWRHRTEDGMADRVRAGRAAELLDLLARDGSGRPVPPSPRERSVTR